MEVKSYLEDAIQKNPQWQTNVPLAVTHGASLPGGFTEFNGSYTTSEQHPGILGGPEYYRAYRESELARMAPDTLARSVKSTWDDGYISMITPEKPAAVSLAGYDVFGPQSFFSSSRNSILDLRGEAAYAPNMVGEMPIGAGMVDRAGSGIPNFSNCAAGCACSTTPMRTSFDTKTPAQLHAECMQAYAKNPNGGMAALQKCARDANVHGLLDTLDDVSLAQSQCVSACNSAGGPAAQECINTCAATYNKRSVQGASVSKSTSDRVFWT